MTKHDAELTLSSKRGGTETKEPDRLGETPRGSRGVCARSRDAWDSA